MMNTFKFLVIYLFTATISVGHTEVAAHLHAQDIDRCPVHFAEGFPRAVKYEDVLWAVGVHVNYNLDREWTFKELRMELAYRKDMKRRVACSKVCVDCKDSKGTIGVTFGNVPPPGENEVFLVKVILVASQPGKADREWWAECPILARSD